ncbi:MAG: transglutaminase family protein [Methanomicrobia archaeon]|nr:transglutaminase family protein [Methanomicrobia archaeon]
MKNKMAVGIVLATLLVVIVAFSGCIEEETPAKVPETATQPPETKVIKDPIIHRAEPYLCEIVTEDINLRTQAASIVSGCPSGDKECQLNGLYRYVVENYDYYSDPRAGEYIQSPQDTMKIKGGDCEDLTILLSSLLENLGIKTYLVLTDTHAYCLACGVDTEDLWQYIEESIITQVSKDLGQKENRKVVIENGNLFVVEEKQQTFVLKEERVYYCGGDGSKFTSPIEYMKIKYDVSSSQPLTIYVVPSRAEFESMSEGQTFKHYPSCQNQDILQISDSCDGLTNYGGLILKNGNLGLFSNKDATVDLKIKFYFYLSPYEFLPNQKISYYELDNQKCIVLDATAGEYGYPGYDAKLEGKKIAIDPVTKEYHYLN